MGQIMDEEIPAEIDFSKGIRGQFFSPNATVSLPVYLDQQVQLRLAAIATAKGLDFSALVNDLLKKDLEQIEMAR